MSNVKLLHERLQHFFNKKEKNMVPNWFLDHLQPFFMVPKKGSALVKSINQPEWDTILAHSSQ